MSSLIETLAAATHLPRGVLQAAVAVAVLLLGLVIARVLGASVQRLVSRHDEGGKTLAPAIGRFTRIAFSLLAIMAGLDQLGIDTSGLLAGLAAAGLAVALALKDTMSDLASGVVLLVRRPFDTGEAVDLGGLSGVVQEIDLFETKLTTFDGVPLTLPNSKIRSGAILNYSRATTRRTDIKVRVPLNADFNVALDTLRTCLTDEARVLKDPDILVNVDSIGDSEAVLLARYHCAADDFLGLKMDMTHLFKTALEKAGMQVPKPQRDVHLLQEAVSKVG